MSAFLIPENLASRNDIPPALQNVAKALRDLLEEDVTVWLEPPVGDGESPPYLLILDPGAGVLLLDVLNEGGRGLQGLKTRLLGRREPHSELVMARLRDTAALFSQRAGAEPRLDSALAIGTAVSAPMFDRAQAEGLGFSKSDLEAMLLKDDFRPGALRDALRRAIGAPRPEPLAEAEERVVRGLLHPEIIIEGAVEDDITDGQVVFRPPEVAPEDVIRVLDREQERLARHLPGGYRVIRGVAGSGKTLVLTFRARFLAEAFPRWRILLTCFNICLAKALAHQLEDLPNVEVRHIDSYAYRVCSAARIWTGNGADRFVETRLKAAEALRGRSDVPHFDVVLVDEAQDFDTAGLDLAYASLAPARDQFVVCLDAAQNIYRNRMRWNPPEMTARGRTTLMRVNYRNTREILDFARRFLARGDETMQTDELLDDPSMIVPPEATSRRGPPPRVLRCRNGQAEVEEVMRLLQERHEQGTPWSRMAILYGRQKPWQNWLYYAARDRGIPYFHLSWTSETKKQVIECGDVVRVSTIQAVKGLEFSRVFMCGMNDLFDPAAEGDPEAVRRLAYVGMTRAMDELVVTFSGQGQIGRDLESAGLA